MSHTDQSPLDQIVDPLDFSRTTSTEPAPSETYYDYRDENGVVLYQVVRIVPKSFRQRTPLGNGEWSWSVGGVRRVLYNLPDILARPGETVFFVEGEKDADRLMSHGLLATTSAGGSSAWQASMAPLLSGRDVIFIPDNDEPGRKYATQACSDLVKHCASVKVLRLPLCPAKGDVSDWLDMGNSIDTLRALLPSAETFFPDSATIVETENADPMTFDGHAPDVYSQLRIPNSPDVEMAVLGAMMRDQRVVTQVFSILQPEDFFIDAHRAIFIAMMAVDARSEPIDLMSVAEQLEKSGALQMVGGRAHLVDVCDSVFTSANVTAHARLVKEKSVLRSLQSFGLDLASKISTAPGDVSSLLSSTEARVMAISSMIPRRDRSFDEQMLAMIEHDRLVAQGKGLGLPWPIPELTFATRGIRPAKFYQIIGFFKSGKTKLLTGTLSKFALLDEPPRTLFFSMEMGAPAILRWLACSDLRIDTASFDMQGMNDGDMRRVHQWVGEHCGSGWLKIDERSFLTPESICGAIRRDYEEYGTKVVAIDYLQKITWASRYSGVMDINRGMNMIHSTIRDLGISMIGLSQVPKSAGDKGGQKRFVDINDSKDAGVFSELCDCAVSITDITRNDQAQPKVFKFIIQQRDGQTRLLDVYGDMRYGTWSVRPSRERAYEATSHRDFRARQEGPGVSGEEPGS